MSLKSLSVNHTWLIRVFELGKEVRDRKDLRFTTQAAAEAACKIWEDGGHKVSPIVRMTGGAS